MSDRPPLRRLDAEPVETFLVDGRTRALRDPDGPPSARQLAFLNDFCALAIVEPDEDRAITAAEAAGAIDEIRRRLFADEPLDPPPVPGFEDEPQ